MPQAKGQFPPGPGRPGQPGSAARPGPPPGPQGRPAAGPNELPPGQLLVDDSAVAEGYANFCRVLSTAEELILDLGLNPNPPNGNGMVVKVSQRVIMNHFTAKRLLTTLAMAVQQHEQAFGPLELNVGKRLRSPGGGERA
ncbi:DUF3467 domain-containing protein [Planctellipticum variicoloris]|uniref:DUF3467 domain-containing protein n=1 Tax=Planctellipticum variicoloris TaxID=3064265 RepID=UPI003013FB82|nr:DUF3467 domain-containing protein [Planctomycetaceae bacterium SH412]